MHGLMNQQTPILNGLFFKIDLQEYFPAFICLSAYKFYQPFSWGGNFYVDSGSCLTSSQVQARFFSTEL